MSQLYTRDKRNNAGVLIVLSTLFFMWGLITVLNFMLVDELKTVFQMTPAEALLVNFIFFATYFIIAIPAGSIINRYGYKNAIIWGIVIAGFGCMLFYPAVENRSYGIFILSLFVLATGITVLQVGANAYVVLVGNRARGAARLTLVQAFNSLGAFLAPLFAAGLFMRVAGLTEESRLAMSPEEFVAATIKYVQLPYLGLGAILFLLALFVGFSRLPKLNTEVADPLAKTKENTQRFILQFPHVVMGGLAIFCYVGAEVTIGRFLANAVGANMAPEIAVPMYWGGALIGRFVGVALLSKVSPRKLIGINSMIAALLVTLAIMLSGSLTPDNIYFIFASVGLFNSVLFPCIYTMGIDGLGRYSEEGSSVLIMSIVGGAIIPMIWGNLFEVSLTASFVLIVISYLYICFFGFKGSRYEKRTNFY